MGPIRVVLKSSASPLWCHPLDLSPPPIKELPSVLFRSIAPSWPLLTAHPRPRPWVTSSAVRPYTLVATRTIRLGE
ncbi:unnamed protein product, partial [Nezara viridula]